LARQLQGKRGRSWSESISGLHSSVLNLCQSVRHTHSFFPHCVRK
jgi:hypothetical protein